MKLKNLKQQKTKSLNKSCETIEQFEEVQNRLNEVELQMMFEQNKNHIPFID